MKLFNRQELTSRQHVTVSSATRCQKGKLALHVGVRLQEHGRLFRTSIIKYDIRDITAVVKQLNAHKQEVCELAAALKETMEWCESRRGVEINPEEPLASFSKVTEQEWPTLFYATHTENRISIHMYGRDLRDAAIAYRMDRKDSYKDWKRELEDIMSNFWKHLEEVEGIRMDELGAVPN